MMDQCTITTRNASREVADSAAEAGSSYAAGKTVLGAVFLGLTRWLIVAAFVMCGFFGAALIQQGFRSAVANHYAPAQQILSVSGR